MLVGVRSPIFLHLRRKHNFANFLEDLQKRSLLRNTYPNELLTKFSRELSEIKPILYAGFDPTAESLHVGNLLILSNLLRASNHGIQPIVVIGGATALIGDPSGRTSERNTAVADVVSSNKESIAKQISTFFNRLNLDRPPIIVDNSEWFSKMNCLDFLRNCKRMQVGEMLRMGAVKSRMESGISFTEFSYQTMQAYDWLILSERYNCHFQMGGSDQLGHLDFGAHYIKKMTGKFAAGLCLPLLTDSSGAKIGKSQGGGSLWLDEKMTSPFRLYQYFAQLPDNEVEKLLPLLSLKPYEEVEEILSVHKKNLGRWIAQKSVAEEITLLVHGESGLESALKCTKALFGGKKADLSGLTSDEIIGMFGQVTKLERREVKTYGQLADTTRSDRQKGSELMKKSAFSVNGQKKTVPEELLTNELLPNTTNLTLVCWGKRNYQLVAWID